MTRAVELLLAGAVSVIVLPDPVWACSCVPLKGPCQSLWANDGTPANLFEATVASMERRTVQERREPGQLPLIGSTRVIFRLENVRDLLGKSSTVVTTDDSSCALTLEVGRRYVIQAYETSEGLAVSQCSNTRLVENAATLLAFVQGLARPGPGGTVSGSTTLTQGMVLEERSRPLGGVRVTLSGPIERQATTAADGTFQFDGLPAGRYALYAEEDPARSLAPKGSSAFMLAHAHACRQVSLPMGLTSLVEGWVRDATGAPVRGKPVQLLRADQGPWPDPQDPFAPTRSESELTSATGRFAFRGVPPGRYFVGTNLDLDVAEIVFAPVYAGAGGKPEVVVLSLGEHRRLPDVTLPHSRVRRAGKVVLADGRPAGNAVVTAAAIESGGRWRTERLYVSSDDAGRFEVALAPGVGYRLEADDFAGGRAVLTLEPGADAITLVLRPRQ